MAGIDVLKRPARVRSVIGTVSQHSGAVGLLTGYENLVLAGPDLRDAAHGAAAPGGRAARPVRAGRGGRAAGDARTRAACGGASTWPPRWCTARPCCSSTSRPPGSTRRVAPSSGRCSPACRRRTGTTILVTTHYLDEADKFAAKVAITDRGRIVAEGTPDQLKARLQGDSVLLELGDAGQVEQAEKALARVPQVRQTTADGAVVRARVADGPRALPAVLAGLETEARARPFRHRRPAVAGRRLPALRRPLVPAKPKGAPSHEPHPPVAGPCSRAGTCASSTASPRSSASRSPSRSSGCCCSAPCSRRSPSYPGSAAGTTSPTSPPAW